MTTPAELPAFSGAAHKRARKESLSEAIGGAAVTIVKALSTHSKAKKEDTGGPGVSPGEAVDLQMKIFSS